MLGIRRDQALRAGELIAPGHAMLEKARRLGIGQQLHDA